MPLFFQKGENGSPPGPEHMTMHGMDAHLPLLGSRERGRGRPSPLPLPSPMLLVRIKPHTGPDHRRGIVLTDVHYLFFWVPGLAGDHSISRSACKRCLTVGKPLLSERERRDMGRSIDVLRTFKSWRLLGNLDYVSNETKYDSAAMTFRKGSHLEGLGCTEIKTCIGSVMAILK